MAEKANVIVKFMLSARKRRGIYFFSATIFIITIFLFFLSVILYEQHLPGRRLALLFALMGILLFFFSLWAIYSLRKDGYVGMIISDEEITDLSTGYRIDTVLWNDVTKIKVMDDLENLNYKYVVLVVKNPNQYIMQEPTAIKKRSLMLKLHQYGSPICFSIRALDCSFKELYVVITSRYQAIRGVIAVIVSD